MADWLKEAFSAKTYRGIHPGMRRSEVVSLLGEPGREKHGRQGCLAYTGVQVFTEHGVVKHLTIRLGELAETVSEADARRCAHDLGLLLRRSPLMSDDLVEYLVCHGLDVIITDGQVDFVSLSDPR